MFTGIVETTGSLIAVGHHRGGLRLTVDTSKLQGTLNPGDSVCVDGVCLTVTRPAEPGCDFDVIRETVRRTCFSDLEVGQTLNLERSMTPTTRFDGHFVQGHVDAVGTIEDIASSEEEWRVRVGFEPRLAALIVPKGSIAVNGVSLTIAEAGSGHFDVALIPLTLSRTNLGGLQIGRRVNLETDILARTLHHQLQCMHSPDESSRLMELLQRQGFA